MPPASAAARRPIQPTDAPDAGDETRLVVSLDVEEDEWGEHPTARGVANTAALPALARRLAAIGVRPTFFVSYVVAADRRAMDHVLEAAELSGAEIAAHLHPWNTPPAAPVAAGDRAALARYPEAAQRAMLATLTEALERATGRRPVAFRAGKLSLGHATVRALADQGYRVDSSVSPYWQPDDEPVEVPLPPDPAAGAWALRVPGAGELLEVALTSGFSRAPFARWERVARAMDTPAGRRLRLGGIAWRSGVLRRLVMSPELCGGDDMLVLWRRLREQGARVVQLTWHSPSLVPGLTPYARDARAAGALVDATVRLVEAVAGEPGVRLAGVTDAAYAALASAAAASVASGATA